MLANYDQLRDLPSVLETKGIDVLITDEAHRIRNLSAQITQAVRKVKRKRFWALTGTPIERDEVDLATLLSTIDPKRFAPS